MAKRYFEYIDDKSSKFWELSVAGKKITVRYGKIGTDGQTTLKEMNAPAEAKAQAEKLALEKIKKGYVEGGYESIKNKNLDGKSIKGGKKISEKSNLKIMPPNISSTNKGELTAPHHVSTAYELGFASAAVVGKIVTLAFCASVHKVLTMGAYWGSGKEESERPTLNLAVARQRRPWFEGLWANEPVEWSYRRVSKKLINPI